jgi:NitT/TauT family transport system substrate-binding protein
VFGDQYQVKWQSFNAGSAEIEAMFAGEVDIGYIGPIPAINGYIKSSRDLKIIAGATPMAPCLSQGKILLSMMSKILERRTIVVPQFRNTQHLCLLNLLSTNGLNTIEKDGNVKVIESSKPDTKTLMDNGDIDAALVPEPWVTRLVNEIGINILLGSDEVWDAGDYSTVSSAQNFMRKINTSQNYSERHILR